jgi:hypothetical protein
LQPAFSKQANPHPLSASTPTNRGRKRKKMINLGRGEENAEENTPSFTPAISSQFHFGPDSIVIVA